jgi:hypothetical protein
MRTEKKTVPRSALCFAATFAGAMDATEPSAEGATLYPFEMVARTGGVAHHPFWGPCIHDFAGMVQPKSSISVDYCHNPAEVIGFSDRISVQGDSLLMAGALVSTQDSDRAHEVASKRKAGVPYEASITTNMNGLEVEFVPEGYTAKVNGLEVLGPISVFRRWELWGVAVLPYGADSRTSIQFGAGAAGDVTVTYSETGGSSVSTQTTPASPARTGQDYLATFGDRGGVWYAQGKPFDECFAQFAAEVKAESESKDATVTELSSKITQLSAELEEAKTQYAAELQKKEDEHKAEMEALKANFAGQIGGDPVSGNPSTPSKPDVSTFNTFAGLTEHQAKFAASLKLPGQTSNE